MNAPKRIIWKNDNKEMVLIPGGTFVMGCDQIAKYGPQHTAQIESFYIDRFPVTNREYKRFVDETSHPVPNYSVSWCDTAGYNWDPETHSYPKGKADHPVVLVTWEDALAFALWAGKRLPTEAEWERAARGPEGWMWPWGNKATANCSNTRETGINTTTPIDQYSPQGDSPYGVADMVGNVWERTSSLFRPYPYDSCDGREDLTSIGWRVLRGGSWINDLYTARCCARLDSDFVFYNNVGFRCAALLPGADDLAQVCEELPV